METQTIKTDKIMNDDQITALAREYAEWITEAEGGNNTYIPAEQAIASTFLHWLSRRYCLVEKAKVKQFFQSRQNILANQNKYDRYMVDEASVEKDLMLCLFPDLGKEVES